MTEKSVEDGGSWGSAGAFARRPSRPPPTFSAVFWHQAGAARCVQPRARTSLQSEAKAAWSHRLTYDLLWRGLSRLDHENIAHPKQAGRACYSARCLLSASRENRPPRSGFTCANFQRQSCCFAPKFCRRAPNSHRRSAVRPARDRKRDIPQGPYRCSPVRTGQRHR
jgi:hypothetical protein